MDDAAAPGPSPFHAGEHEAQDRAGVRDKIEAFGRRVIRDYLPEQHREFYALLPSLLVGSVDGQGRPWASLLAGPPGFLSTPDARSLEVKARPLPGDPLNETLRAGADLGLLGIQPSSRRRNRMNGRVTFLGAGGIRIAVAQTFGNCPQYIQARELDWQPETARAEPIITRGARLSEADRALIAGADTLFIATASGAGVEGPARGADVSHRGGKSGFVRVEDDQGFVFPDYSGNFHFNSVGNIILNPQAGFLFIDYDRGGLLYLTGRAEIVWDGEAVDAFAGAERLIRFTLEKAVSVEGSLPLRFRFGEYSPSLEMTGSWEETDQTIAANRERDRYLDYEVTEVVRESETVSSFYLRRADGKAPPSYKAGQFLPIRLEVPGEQAPATRTYTLSEAPGRGHYRLSVKREGRAALVSNHLHVAAEKGFRLQAMAPRGKFALDESSDRPVVLISAGVGITPMIAMAGHIINEGKRTRNFRRTHVIHGARNGRVQAFGETLRGWARDHESFTAHLRFSAPEAGDRLGESHDSEGRIDAGLLRSLLPLDDYDFYLCGPGGFMQDLFDILTRMGVREGRIRYESFGPATLIRGAPGAGRTSVAEAPAAGPVAVRFDGADREATWSADKGTLLDLAEEAGLSPAYACRSGICGSCATRIKCGSVDYLEEPVGPREDDEVLICCSTPRPASGEGGCGETLGVVLDL